jgi:hypothetical protein
MVEALIHQMDPVGQCQNIKTLLNGPGLLLQTTKQKKAKKACTTALNYSSKLVKSDIYGIEQAKIVYFLKKDGELPIVVDSGASYSITPNFNNSVVLIRECLTKEELNELNTPMNVVGKGKFNWKIQDLFGFIRSIKTTSY